MHPETMVGGSLVLYGCCWTGGVELKALVIAPEPFFSPRGTPLSVYYRTLVAAELGVRIDLLTYGEGQDVAIPGVRIIRIPRFRWLGPVPVGPSVLKLFLDLFLVVWTVGLLMRNRYDFVHAHEEAVFFCRFLKAIFRFKLVYDMHSSLPEQLTNFRFANHSVFIGLLRRLEHACLRVADAIITICPALALRVNRILDREEKHFLIENSIFEQIRTVPARRGCEQDTPAGHQGKPRVGVPESRPLVVYAGTLERYQGVDILLSGFGEVVAKRPEAFLLVVGGTDRQVEEYRALARRVGVAAHCLFTGKVPPQIARSYNQMAAVLVSPRKEGMNTPLKIYEQLASGVPLVATRVESHTQVLDDQVAILVEPTPAGVAYGILRAMEQKEEVLRIAERARRRYEERYSRPVYVSKMRELLESLR